jgi:hypothetical protein
MTGIKRFVQPIVILAAAGALAGCAAASLPSATSQVQPAGVPIADKCTSDNGISVKPCAVQLTAKKTSTTVTTKGPKGGTFSVKDPACTTRGVATVSGSGDTYTISAGTKHGQCIATFVDYDSGGKRLGAAKLIIVNQTRKQKHTHK